MADLNELNQEVAGLNKTTSNDFQFMDALDHIEEAAKTVADQDIGQLRQIVNSFRLKLPNRETLGLDRIRARDLGSALMLNTLQKRIDRINSRNENLSNLNSRLDDEISKGNSDAARLTTIKTAVEKATKTVDQAKTLVDQLTNTDATTRTRLKALIDALGNVSTIFQPNAV